MGYLFLGTIVGLKGLDGTLKIATDSDISPKANSKVRIGYSLKYSQDFTVAQYRTTSSKYNYLKLKEIEDLEEAKKLIEMGVFVAENDVDVVSQLKEHPEALGFKVIDIKTGEQIGIALEIISNPGNDLILIQTQQGEFYLPFIDVFVKHFDDQNKRIFVELIDGIID